LQISSVALLSVRPLDLPSGLSISCPPQRPRGFVQRAQLEMQPS
jgi:hypothetical protein